MLQGRCSGVNFPFFSNQTIQINVLSYFSSSSPILPQINPTEAFTCFWSSSYCHPLRLWPVRQHKPVMWYTQLSSLITSMLLQSFAKYIQKIHDLDTCWLNKLPPNSDGSNSYKNVCNQSSSINIARAIGFWCFHLYSKPLSL